ncbi:MFS transporter [Micromonosporaceae bacterium Da 78-11]
MDTARSTPHVLRDADFRRWFLARSISYGGTAATAVALPLLAYQQTGSAVLTGAVTALEALPYLAFGLLAGAMADRVPRLRLMVAAEILAAVLVVSAPLAQAAGVLSGVHVLVVAFAIGTAFCWFDAAAWGALTQVAGRDRLTQANSLIWATATVIGIAVPAAAGLVATLADPSVVLVADALTYLISVVLLCRIGTQLDTTGPRAVRPSIRRDIAAGLSYLWHQPVIRTLSLTGFALSTAAGGILALLVVHAHENLGLRADDHRIGLLYSAAAVGALLSAVLLPAMTRRLGIGALSTTAYVLFFGAVVALAGSDEFVTALALWALADFASATAITNAITVRQQLTPDDLQGRVNTTGRMIAWGGTPFGALAGGVVADRWGTGPAYLVLSLPIAVAVIVLLLSPVVRLRRLD